MTADRSDMGLTRQDVWFPGLGLIHDAFKKGPLPDYSNN